MQLDTMVVQDQAGLRRGRLKTKPIEDQADWRPGWYRHGIQLYPLSRFATIPDHTGRVYDFLL